MIPHSNFRHDHSSKNSLIKHVLASNARVLFPPPTSGVNNFIKFQKFENKQLPLRGSRMTIISCIFQNCGFSNVLGGAILSRAPLGIQGCYFTNCVADLGGGVLCKSGLHVSSTVFSLGVANTGSAIECQSGKEDILEIVQCTTQQCSSNSYGTIHRQLPGAVLHSKSNITYCSATELVAGLGYDGASLKCSFSIFSLLQGQNAAGMALFTSQGAEISDTIFCQNFVQHNGKQQLINNPCLIHVIGQPVTMSRLTITRTFPAGQNVLSLSCITMCDDCVFDFTQDLGSFRTFTFSGSNPFGLKSKEIVARVVDPQVEATIKAHQKFRPKEEKLPQPFPIWMIVFGFIGGLLFGSTSVSFVKDTKIRKKTESQLL